MSTAFDWRDLTLPTRRDEAPPDRRAGPPAAATIGRRGGQAASRLVAARLRRSLNRARLVATLIVGLSLLGLLYLAQISHVARYGYRLSDLQRQQDRTARENQLLEYQLTVARGLGPVEDLAARSYGMQPLVPRRTQTAAGAAGATGATGAAATPQARYITVQRPPAARPPAAPPLAPPNLLDRLVNRLIGIGVAGR